MSENGKVCETQLTEDGAVAAGIDVADNTVATSAAQVPDLCLNDEVRAYLRGIVDDLEKFGGLGATRIKAIAYGDEATNGELEELGYVFVGLLRALTASTDAPRVRDSETPRHS
jgi:hypothetical protein